MEDGETSSTKRTVIPPREREDIKVLSTRERIARAVKERIFGSSPNLSTNVKVRAQKRISYKLINWKLVRIENISIHIYFHMLEEYQMQEIETLAQEVILEVVKSIPGVIVTLDIEEEDRWAKR